MVLFFENGNPLCVIIICEMLYDDLMAKKIVRHIYYDISMTISNSVYKNLVYMNKTLYDSKNFCLNEILRRNKSVKTPDGKYSYMNFHKMIYLYYLYAIRYWNVKSNFKEIKININELGKQFASFNHLNSEINLAKKRRSSYNLLLFES